MSDLHKFLREARHEVSMKKFEEDAEAGRISDYEYGSRLRLVGNPEKPLAARVGFRTHGGWRRFCEMMSTEPPEIREFEQTADGWVEVE